MRNEYSSAHPLTAHPVSATRPLIYTLLAATLLWLPLTTPSARAQGSSAPPASAPAAGAAAASTAVSADGAAANWQSWQPRNDVRDLESLRRGASNFMNYCNGCHALKYLRYQRMADDLKIPPDQLTAHFIAPGHGNLDYITTAMPAADSQGWFGKTPPDLSVIARARGPAYLYRFLKTFYIDATRPSGSNNLAYPATAMPAVLSDLEGVKSAVFKDARNSDGGIDKEFEHFDMMAPGTQSAQEFDQFVRDTVNFLDYAGEPTQVERQSWASGSCCFCYCATVLSYLLKREYWKAVQLNRLNTCVGPHCARATSSHESAAAP